MYLFRYGNCDTYFGAFDCPTLTQLLYSWAMRNITSLAQFWRSPNRTDYLLYNTFLPYINDELETTLRHKKNFVSVGHVYLFASDGGLLSKEDNSNDYSFHSFIIMKNIKCV